MCDAKIRPFYPINDSELICDREAPHEEHHGTLRNYAFPGSSSNIYWFEEDRRTFRGDWSPCPLRVTTSPGRNTRACILPAGHRSECAV